MLFYWYQSYHWYQWRPFLSPLIPMESICEYWTTLRHIAIGEANGKSRTFTIKQSATQTDCAGSLWFWPILYFLCETSTWHLDSCPPEDTWYGVILWVFGVLGVRALSQSARIFLIRVFSYCCAILTSPNKGETAVCGYNVALF